jgi:O-antigen biosynthesis protein WbqV
VDRLASTPVLGCLDDLASLHADQPFSMAIVSLPRALLPAILRIRGTLRRLGIPERFVPVLHDVLTQAGPAAPAPVSTGIDLADLIGRTPYGIDRRAVAEVLAGQRVLVTGAGGSIGSELCRIAATFGPAQLIMVERSENALFEIDRQIARRFPEVQRKAVLHDVADEAGTRRLLMGLKADVIFHAAAHKHVPLMEDHPALAVTNNLFGTRSVADAAEASGCRRFVMISSDKAVNPTSVMGATKRLAEMYVQGLHARGQKRTSFSMVRFGNVLGSACSVLPIWESQLAEGGPVTVTDPRMTRYFMTIHEAAALVIQSAAIDACDAAAPSVYVLDMGEPIRILDLARRFVRLSGFEPRLADVADPADRASGSAARRSDDRPVMDVVLTGIRPGEKLHEELAYAAETLLPTPFAGIRAWRGGLPAGFDLERMVADLDAARRQDDPAAAVAAIRAHVPEMRSPADPARGLAAA